MGQKRSKIMKIYWRIMLLLIAGISMMALSSCLFIDGYINGDDSEEAIVQSLEGDMNEPSATPEPPRIGDATELAPTEKPGPTPLPEKEPTEKPEATPTPVVIVEPEASAAPTLAMEPAATSTPKATATPAPKPTLKPTVTSTPKPTSKPTVTSTPKPTSKPTVTPTSKPTPKPTITSAPKPTAAPEADMTPPPRDRSISEEEYAKLIIKQIIRADMEEVDKVKAVHDYIVLNTAYDEENLKADTLPEESFTVEGVLFRGKAVCQGYAETFELFMNLLGIDCKFVEGKDVKSGISHAWNMVLLNGDWYQVDVTWDDPIPDQTGKVQYKYFLVTDQVMSADHSWIMSKYPVCNSVDYQYYVYKDYIIDSFGDYEEKFMELYNSGERTITILYPEEGKPDMSFLKKYDYLYQTVDGKKIIHYSWYPTWRMGDYTVLTVMMD